MPVTIKQKEHPLSLRERARERGYKYRQSALFYPLSPTLLVWEREFVGQQWVPVPCH
jgi:hypothetical protein